MAHNALNQPENWQTSRTDAAWSSGFDPVVVSAAELARRLREQCADLERENAALRSLLREAIREHVDPYDLPEGDHYIARVEAALGEEDQS